jgi:hypothetical protein
MSWPYSSLITPAVAEGLPQAHIIHSVRNDFTGFVLAVFIQCQAIVMLAMINVSNADNTKTCHWIFIL